MHIVLSVVEVSDMLENASNGEKDAELHFPSGTQEQRY